MAFAAVIRMTALADSPVYRANALMNANPFALGVALLIFGLFNRIFVGGFFKTAYKLGRPFVTYIVVCFLTIAIAETLHHIPGLEWLNAFGTERGGLQALTFAAGLAAYILLTALSCKKAYNDFENIDL